MSCGTLVCGAVIANAMLCTFSPTSFEILLPLLFVFFYFPFPNEVKFHKALAPFFHQLPSAWIWIYESPGKNCFLRSRRRESNSWLPHSQPDASFSP
jgi:hypothetical protein